MTLQKRRPIDHIKYEEGEREEEAREPIYVYSCLSPVAEGLVLGYGGWGAGSRVRGVWEYVLQEIIGDIRWEHKQCDYRMPLHSTCPA